MSKIANSLNSLLWVFFFCLIAYAFIDSLVAHSQGYQDLCPESHAVIVNGEFVGCTGDRSQSPANTWIPEAK